MWTPINLEELWQQITQSEPEMEPAARRLWELIRIEPTKWQQHPWGDHGKGFWAVGIFGSRVLWYNDIEHGFNISKYTCYGTIDEYWCNQDELHHAIYTILHAL